MLCTICLYLLVTAVSSMYIRLCADFIHSYLFKKEAIYLYSLFIRPMGSINTNNNIFLFSPSSRGSKQSVWSSSSSHDLKCVNNLCNFVAWSGTIHSAQARFKQLLPIYFQRVFHVVIWVEILFRHSREFYTLEMKQMLVSLFQVISISLSCVQ